MTVGYNAFYPLPEAFFTDPEAVRQRSRSATARSRPTSEFVPGQGITLTRYDEYAGDEKAKADSVEFRVYTDVSTAYTDAQDGNLDILDDIPPDAIATRARRVR